MAKQGCVHPLSRIRSALICSDCGSEVPASHILGDPLKGITAEALSPVGWGDKEKDGTGTGLVNGGDPVEVHHYGKVAYVSITPEAALAMQRADNEARRERATRKLRDIRGLIHRRDRGLV